MANTERHLGGGKSWKVHENKKKAGCHEFIAVFWASRNKLIRKSRRMVALGRGNGLLRPSGAHGVGVPSRCRSSKIKLGVVERKRRGPAALL